MPGAPTILSHLRALPAALPARPRVLVLTTPRRRHLDAVRAALGDIPVTVFDQAQVHVPQATVDAAVAALDQAQANTLLTLGGGSATGLGKALKRARPDVRLAAVATTFAGSELTSIFGITDAGEKVTGRDPAARPDVVVHDPALLQSLPPATAVASLANALAHPVSALSTGLPDADVPTALRAVKAAAFALRQVVAAPAAPTALAAGLAAAARCARVLDAHPMGAHHRLAHRLGGTHDLPHASLHAVLLPQTLAHLRETDPALAARIDDEARDPDLAASVHDTLRRVGLPVALKDLDLDLDAVAGAVADAGLPAAFAPAALFGWRPAHDVVRTPVGGGPALRSGDLDQAQTVVVALHGRGAEASSVIGHVRHATGHAPGLAVVAPQADGGAWYRAAYNAPAAELGPQLEGAMTRVRRVLDEVRAEAPQADIVLYGFSQGACLALRLLADGAAVAGVLAPAGALPPAAQKDLPDLDGRFVLLSLAEGDRWVAHDDVTTTAGALRDAGADVRALSRPGTDHALTDRDRLWMRRLLGQAPATIPHGFGAHHQAEALPGAVPPAQNNPRHAPYGLYAEQISGTGFVAPRDENLRTWLYRIRPAAQPRAYAPLAHPTLCSGFDDVGTINLEAWNRPDEPAPHTDFVDGLITVGGAGHPALRRGYAVHFYRANADMTDRAFTNADGDLLIVPDHGRLTVLTELGSLDAGPGDVLIIPRGLRFTVLLHDPSAGGYVAEVFARHFRLPDRGPVGANGLADERHFTGPARFYEDRLAPGYRLTAKMGGAVYETTQDFSPYDVVGWHGNYVPYVYDLERFVPVSNTRVDHTDPSAFTVVSAALDETGAHALDLVVFPPRWDPTEHTFRPPYFHRNVTTEINGIVRSPGLSAPFEAGMLFVTPSMTPHGVLARTVDSHLARDDDDADRPVRTDDRSLWFQFETALPFGLTPWAKTAPERRGDWPTVWGAVPRRFVPS